MKAICNLGPAKAAGLVAGLAMTLAASTGGTFAADSSPSLSVSSFTADFSAMETLKDLAAKGKGKIGILLPETTTSARYTSFDAPYLKAAELIQSGGFGRARMITAVNHTDFLYRPRRPEELDTAQGGGVVFSQGAHQIDIVRLLGGGLASGVRATIGRFDPARPTEGAYQAFLTFVDGASATLTYSGYGRYDSDEQLGWIGEMGQRRDPESYGAARRALARVSSPEEEAALKNARTYGVAGHAISPPVVAAGHNHFGPIMICCEQADLRPLADGVMIYADESRWLEPLPAPTVPRAEVIDELHAAARKGVAPLHSGAWGMATLEVCLAILHSARTGAEVALRHQVRPAAGPATSGS